VKHLVDPSLYALERELDAGRGVHVCAFKSWLAIEVYGSSATIKVDYDLDVNKPLKKNFALAFGKLNVMVYESKAYDQRGHNPVYGTPFDDAIGYRTKKGLHLRAWTFRPTRMTDEAILAFQAALGDDPRRQAFNATRVAKGKTNWNVLWNVKLRNGVVVSRERQDPMWTDRFRRWLKVE
jgi:hypothetical protein